MGATSVGFGGASVAPGQTFRFSIALTAPMTSGTYHSAWQLEQRATAFGNQGMFMAVTVVPADNARWQAVPQSAIVRPGQASFIAFTYLNTGSTTWTDAAGYALACDPTPSDSAGCLQGQIGGLLG